MYIIVELTSHKNTIYLIYIFRIFKFVSQNQYLFKRHAAKKFHQNIIS